MALAPPGPARSALSEHRRLDGGVEVVEAERGCARAAGAWVLHGLVCGRRREGGVAIYHGEDAGCLSSGHDALGLAGLTYRRLQHWYSWQAVPGLERFVFQNWWWSGWLFGFGGTKSRWAREGAARVERRRKVLEDGKGKGVEGGDL